MRPNLDPLLPRAFADCLQRCGRVVAALSRAGRERVRAVVQGAGSADAFLKASRVLGLIALVQARLKALLDPQARPPKAAAEAAERAERPDGRERPEREDLEERERFPWERRDRRPLRVIIGDICRTLGFGPEEAAAALAPFVELEALLAGAGPTPSPAAATAQSPPPASAWRPPPARLNRRRRRAAARAAARVRRDPRGPP